MWINQIVVVVAELFIPQKYTYALPLIQQSVEDALELTDSIKDCAFTKSLFKETTETLCINGLNVRELWCVCKAHYNKQSCFSYQSTNNISEFWHLHAASSSNEPYTDETINITKYLVFIPICQ